MSIAAPAGAVEAVLKSSRSAFSSLLARSRAASSETSQQTSDCVLTPHFLPETWRLIRDDGSRPPGAEIVGVYSPRRGWLSPTGVESRHAYGEVFPNRRGLGSEHLHQQKGSADHQAAVGEVEDRPVHHPVPMEEIAEPAKEDAVG